MQVVSSFHDEDHAAIMESKGEMTEVHPIKLFHKVEFKPKPATSVNLAACPVGHRDPTKCRLLSDSEVMMCYELYTRLCAKTVANYASEFRRMVSRLLRLKLPRDEANDDVRKFLLYLEARQHLINNWANSGDQHGCNFRSFLQFIAPCSGDYELDNYQTFLNTQSVPTPQPPDFAKEKEYPIAISSLTMQQLVDSKLVDPDWARHFNKVKKVGWDHRVSRVEYLRDMCPEYYREVLGKEFDRLVQHREVTKEKKNFEVKSLFEVLCDRVRAAPEPHDKSKTEEVKISTVDAVLPYTGPGHKRLLMKESRLENDLGRLEGTIKKRQAVVGELEYERSLAEQQIAREMREIAELQFRRQLMQNEAEVHHARVEIEEDKLKIMRKDLQKKEMEKFNKRLGKIAKTGYVERNFHNPQQEKRTITMEEHEHLNDILEELNGARGSVRNVINGQKLSVMSADPHANFSQGKNVLPISAPKMTNSASALNFQDLSMSLTSSVFEEFSGDSRASTNLRAQSAAAASRAFTTAGQSHKILNRAQSARTSLQDQKLQRHGSISMLKKNLKNISRNVFVLQP